MRIPDHREQRLRHLHAIDAPGRIKDFVAAMFRVRLGEHHQLGVGGIASETLITGKQVIQLFIAQGQTELGVGGDQAIASFSKHRHGGQTAQRRR